MYGSVDSKIVLSLNAGWQAIGIKSVRQAIKDLTAQNYHNTPAALALDLTHGVNEDGTYNFGELLGAIPTKWDDWINLGIRDYDFYINTPKMKIRVPTIIITPNYNKIHKRTLKPTKKAILERDKQICQYSGVRINRKEGNIDHIVPVSRGGKDSWENMVWAHKEINAKKRNKLNSEAGLTLIRKPKAPLPMPPSSFIREIKHRDWSFFLPKFD